MKKIKINVILNARKNDRVHKIYYYFISIVGKGNLSKYNGQCNG